MWIIKFKWLFFFSKIKMIYYDGIKDLIVLEWCDGIKLIDCYLLIYVVFIVFFLNMEGFVCNLILLLNEWFNYILFLKKKFIKKES